MFVRYVLPKSIRFPKDYFGGLSGINRSTYELAEWMSKNYGISTELVAKRYNSQPKMQSLNDNLDLNRLTTINNLGFRGIDFSYQMPFFFYSIVNPKPDVLHVAESPFLLRAPRARSKVFQIHSNPEEISNEYCRSLHKADLVISPSEFLKQKLISKTDYPSDSIKVVPHGVNRDELAQGDGSKFRDRHNIPENAVIISYVGQLSSLKGTMDLIDAVNSICDKNLGIHLVIIGSSDLWTTEPDTDYENRVREKANNSIVTFTGILSNEELANAYAAADIHVTPSRVKEGFGLVNIESMASSTPVIATNVGALPETVRHGENGYLYSVGDINALAQYLYELIQNEELRVQMGTRAFQIVNNKYTLEQSASAVLELYQNML